ncbi:MAG: TonB-dependent receptor plug domain-containing protein, partial [Ignavibacteria bacterium]|nr:TonB-dependent receptor plug domain-containing protein [Ignavibacteria bacterium]
LLNFPSGTISDNDGNYLIDGIPVGKQKLKFSTIGYDSRIMEVEIVSNKIVTLNITLEENPIEISEVKIIGSKARTHSDTRTSVIELDPKSAKILPGAAEDVMRTLQSLPGVLAPNDFSSQLIVRGSGPDQNLIIIDDIEIFNPYRLYGAVSMFNPDAVSDVNLISGGFPAKYGDRLSAVLDVTNKEGSKTSYLSGSLNASIISANLILEGKNPFDLNGSWTINSRRTYYDLIIEPFIKKAGLVDENVSLPNFYDVQSKFVFGPFQGNKFILNAIYSQDGVDVVSGIQRKTADSISINNLTKNNVLGFGWHYSAKRRFFNKLTISYYQNSGATNFNSEVLDPSLNRKDFENVVSDTLSPYLLGFKFDNDFTFKKTSFDDKITYQTQSHTIEAGAGIDLLETVVNFHFKIDP